LAALVIGDFAFSTTERSNNMARRSNSEMQNLKQAGWTAARFTGRAAEKTAVNLFRWAAIDHSGMSKALDNMPPMGFLDTVKYILMQFLIAVASAIFAGIWIFVLIGYGIPFLITGKF